MPCIDYPSSFQLSTWLGPHQSRVEQALREMHDQQILTRLWNRDHTIWKPEPTEIHNRLGWLHLAETMQSDISHINQFAHHIHDAGYTHVLLLGMGGSSLAPTVFNRLFSTSQSPLQLAVLDSTNPNTVNTYTEMIEPSRTLFLISSKSGTTVETLSLFNHFYNQVAARVEAQDAGKHFAAITDPKSPLAELAARYGFREIFLADPNLGGRYSALSHFGLVPAALIGVNLVQLLDRVVAMAQHCGADGPIELNPGAQLGAILSELAQVRHDKITLLTSASLAPFGNWVEQLLAESTGKDGKGLNPILHEPLGLSPVYADDRLFIYLMMAQDDETQVEHILDDLIKAGNPVVRLQLNNPNEIGGQFFLWEIATAIAASRLKINPFDQPNVEAAKQSTQDAVNAYRCTGALSDEVPTATFDDIRLYGLDGPVTADSPDAALHLFLAQGQPGDYVSLQAYLPLPIEVDTTYRQLPELTQLMRETTEIQGILLGICGRIRDKYGLASTFGYGPRYLHSTGQLHKGDAGQGLFIQFTTDAPEDIPIPEVAGELASAMSFGTLEAAQAMGDRDALEAAGRRIIRFHLGSHVTEQLKQLSQSIL